MFDKLLIYFTFFSEVTWIFIYFYLDPNQSVCTTSISSIDLHIIIIILNKTTCNSCVKKTTAWTNKTTMGLNHHPGGGSIRYQVTK